MEVEVGNGGRSGVLVRWIRRGKWRLVEETLMWIRGTPISKTDPGFFFSFLSFFSAEETGVHCYSVPSVYAFS